MKQVSLALNRYRLQESESNNIHNNFPSPTRPRKHTSSDAVRPRVEGSRP